MVRRRSVIVIVFVVLAASLVLAACSQGSPPGGGGTGGGGGGSTVPDAVVAPGTTEIAPSGVAIGVPDDAFDTPIPVVASEAPDPGDPSEDPPLVTVLGRYTVGSATGDDIAAPDAGPQPPAPFLIGLPIPEGTPTDDLALAIRTPTGEVDFDFQGTEDEEAYVPDSPWTWDVLPGVVDADEGYFLGSLDDLAAGGRIVALVQGAGLGSPTITPSANVERQQIQLNFDLEASCVGFAGLGRADECTPATEAIATQELETVFSDMIGLGFKYPYLDYRAQWRGLFAPIVIDVTYLMQIRPFQTDDDWDGVCKVDAGGSGNHGRYNRNSRTAVVCFGDPVNSGPTDFDAGRIDTLRHEYFHASQYPYTSGATSWFKESTAVAAQESLTTMVRGRRGVRDVDVPLTGGRHKYSLQDFWIFLGKRYGVGLPAVIPFLEAGGDTAAVDAVLTGNTTYPGAGGFDDTYWRWVKNQSFEKLFPLGGDGFAVTCGLDRNASGGEYALEGGDDPITLAYSLEAPPNDAPVGLAALDAAVFKVDFVPLTSRDYATTLRVTSSGGAVRAKFYPEGERGTTDCWARQDGLTQSLTVPQGQARTWYVLVANTSLGQGSTVRLEFEPDAPTVEIVEPEAGEPFDEDDTIPLRAIARGFQGADPDLVATTWSYENDAGTQIVLGTTEKDESLAVDTLCDGTYTITAEARDALTSTIATDTVTFTVQNASPPPARCAPSIAIVTPEDGSVFPLDDDVAFAAVIDDDDDSTDDPLFPVTWRDGGPNGLIIAQGPLSFSSDKWSEGVREIHVSYGIASDSITIEIVDTTNTKPTPSIASPDDGAYFNFFDGSTPTIPLSGSATDDQDGALPGSSLAWSYRDVGDVAWTFIGTGTSETLQLPIFAGRRNLQIRLEATDSGGLSGEVVHGIVVDGILN